MRRGDELTKKLQGTLGAAFTVAVALIAFGCGGGGGGGSPVQPASSPVQVRVGDAPSDLVLAFEITISQVVLNNNTGGTFAALSSPVTLELSHRAATFNPIELINIPLATYTGATVTLGASQITYVDPATGTVKQQQFAVPPLPITITFPTPITIGVGASLLNVDFNLRAGVSLNGTSFSFDPTQIVTTNVGIGQGTQRAENGAAEDVTGSIVGISGMLGSAGSSFILSVQQASGPLTFKTDANTVFSPSAAAVAVNTIVEVEGISQPDGSLLATSVRAEIENGGLVIDALQAEGIVVGRNPALPPTPAVQIQMVVQATAAPGITFPAVGSTFTADINLNTRFDVDAGDFDLTGFPVFGPTSLTVAQKVEAATDGPSATHITARAVVLKRQTLTGQVSGLVGDNFLVTVDLQSSFALLTGQTAIFVNKQAGTLITGALANGSTVRVRGLLFFDPMLGTYSMLAMRIDVSP